MEEGTYEELLSRGGQFAQLLKDFAIEKIQAQKSKEMDEEGQHF